MVPAVMQGVTMSWMLATVAWGNVPCVLVTALLGCSTLRSIMALMALPSMARKNLPGLVCLQHSLMSDAALTRSPLSALPMVGPATGTCPPAPTMATTAHLLQAPAPEETAFATAMMVTKAAMPMSSDLLAFLLWQREAMIEHLCAPVIRLPEATMAQPVCMTNVQSRIKSWAELLPPWATTERGAMMLG